jgi:hypothetical protein
MIMTLFNIGSIRSGFKITNHIGINILVGLMMLSCHKHHDPDPCANLHPVSASFRTEEDFSYVVSGWIYYNTDTIATRRVKFTANEENATYLWKIGTGTYTQKSFFVDFPDSFLLNKTSVPITLIVNKNPSPCFPNDNGMDTITKVIHFTDRTLEQGKFNGYWESNPSDTFTVTISYKYNSFIHSIQLYLNNFDRDTGCSVFSNSTGADKEVTFFSQYSTCARPCGNMMIGPDNNSITIKYTLQDTVSNIVTSHTFIGKRK